MAKEDLNQETLDKLAEFVTNRKEMYQQEISGSDTDLEIFVWAELITLLDEISGILGIE